MTTQTPAQQDSEPVKHVQIDEWMTQADFNALWIHVNQEYNDARHDMQPAMEKCDEK
tara:strand:- start:8175 stop:8345 length:171 start_codon:yes stop_codon:yes gene_type:complete